jgi:hypothetical protein
VAQPVRILFVTEGVDRVTEAFRTVEQAARRTQSSVSAQLGKQAQATRSSAQATVQAHASAERAKTSNVDKEASKREAAEKREADKSNAYWRKAHQKRLDENARADAKAAQDAKRAADKLANAKKHNPNATGIEGLSKKEAVSMLFGSSSAGMASLGGIGMAIGGAMALKSALSLAANALTQFGGFVINEVLRPALAAKKGAAQMANTGAGSAAGIYADSRAMALAHGVGVDKAQAAMGAAYEKTRDYGSAKSVAGLALSQARAYGIDDVGGLTSHLATMRTQLHGMKDSEFAAFASTLVGQSKTGGLSLATQAALGGTTSDIARSFTGGSAGLDARNIAGVQGIVGMSAQSTGDAQKSAAGLASLVELAKTMRVGLDTEGRVKDVNALVPAMIEKLGGSAAAMNKRGVGADTIDFLRPFMDKMKNGGATGLIASIASAGTDAKATAGITGKDEATVAQTTQERLDGAIERLKEKLVTLLPAFEHVIGAFTDNAPAFEAVVDNALIPFGVALGDVVAFTINNLQPGMELLSGLFEVLAGATRVAVLPLTILPGVILKAMAMLVDLVPQSLQTEGMQSFVAGANKYGDLAFGSGSLDQMLGGADKAASALANLKVDRGATAVANPFSSSYHHGATPANGNGGGALPGSLGWTFGGGGQGGAASPPVAIDKVSANIIGSAIADSLNGKQLTGRHTPISDPFRLSF